MPNVTIPSIPNQIKPLIKNAKKARMIPSLPYFNNQARVLTSLLIRDEVVAE